MKARIAPGTSVNDTRWSSQVQKNLTGQFNFATTNMNLSIANVRSPLINSVINVIVGIPDLIRNPAAAIGNLLGGLTGMKTASRAASCSIDGTVLRKRRRWPENRTI